MDTEKTKAKNKKLFIVCSVLTIGLVLTGWFFSFRETWRGFNFSLSGWQKAGELKKEMQDIASDFKANVQTTTNEAGGELEATIEVIEQNYNQQEKIKEIIGENMKDNLQNQYGETQEDNQTSVQ